MEMVPESTIGRPEIELSNVDLPAPLEPISVTKSPGARSRETSISALRSFAVRGKKVLEISSILSIGHLPSGHLRGLPRELGQQECRDNEHGGRPHYVIPVQADWDSNVS